MVIRVSQELCAGCGACVDACDVGAIQLVDQKATIDHALCTQCMACIDLCPNAAITAISIPAQIMPVATPPVVEPYQVLIQEQASPPEKASPFRTLAPIAGAALSYLGREAGPRLIDVLITALERRFAQSTSTTNTSLSTSSRGFKTNNQGKQRQTRFRGGHAGNRNSRGRR